MRDKKVLVTGGAGFIGANLIRLLLAREVTDITVLDDLSTGFLSNLDGLPVEFIEGSITDASVVEKLGADADAIVHLGALGSVALSMEDPVLSHNANATGTLNVLETARANGDTHVVLASSAAVYGASQELPKVESMPTAPVSPYAASKIATEQYGLAWQAAYGVPVTAFRFFNVYGPFQPANHAYAPVIPAFLAAAMGGKALTIHGDGEQTRDFVFVQTVCETIVDAIDRCITHDAPINLASGTQISLLDVISEIEAALGVTIAREHTDERIGDLKHSSASIADLERLFAPNTVSFSDGLRSTIDWWKTQTN